MVVDTGAAITYTNQKRRIFRHFLMIISGSKQTTEELGGTPCAPLGVSQQDHFPLSRHSLTYT